MEEYSNAFEPEVVLVAQGDGRELDGRDVVDLDVRHGVVRVVSQHTRRHLLREVSQDSKAHQHPKDSVKEMLQAIFLICNRRDCYSTQRKNHNLK